MYYRLENGDQTALEPWNLHLPPNRLGYSAGKAANQAYGHRHENLFDERYHDAWSVAADIGRDVPGKTKMEASLETTFGRPSATKLTDAIRRIGATAAPKASQVGKASGGSSRKCEIPVVTAAMAEILEELERCCQNDFERKVIRLFIENGDDPERSPSFAKSPSKLFSNAVASWLNVWPNACGAWRSRHEDRRSRRRTEGNAEAACKASTEASTEAVAHLEGRQAAGPEGEAGEALGKWWRVGALAPARLFDRYATTVS